MNWRIIHRTTTITILLLGLAPARGWGAGDTLNWVNAGAGNWLEPDYWDPPGPPDGGDIAYVRNGGISQIVAGPNAYAFQLHLGEDPPETIRGAGTVEIFQGGSLYVGGDCYIGRSGSGTVGVLGGCLTNPDQCHIGYNNGSGLLRIGRGETAVGTAGRLVVLHN